MSAKQQRDVYADPDLHAVRLQIRAVVVPHSHDVLRVDVHLAALATAGNHIQDLEQDMWVVLGAERRRHRAPGQVVPDQDHVRAHVRETGLPSSSARGPIRIAGPFCCICSPRKHLWTGIRYYYLLVFEYHEIIAV